MVVTTTSEIPGFRAVRTHGLVRGNTPKALLATAFLALGTSACATAGSEPSSLGTVPKLEQRLAARLFEPPFDRVHWGILVVDPSGRTLYDRNSSLFFIPGSNMKVPVAVAALGVLGPDYRWQTTFYSRVLPEDGVLDGNLYLAAQGDPTLGEPFYESSDVALQAIADILTGEGVREVTGQLVVDVSLWDSTTVVDSWMVEDLPVTAGATGGAFVLDRGELMIQVRGGDRAGDPAEVEWRPGTPDSTTPNSASGASRPFVEGQVVTREGAERSDLRVSYRPESRQWLVEGAVGPSERRSLNLSARDPVRLAVAALAEGLANRGVHLGGGTRILWERGLPIEAACESGRVASCAELIRVAGIASPPLTEVVSAILGPSQNWMTEQLVRTLGAERGEAGSWQEGFSVIEAFLAEEIGLDPGEINWEDGSGLSNHNLITPQALVDLLRYARIQSWGSEFRAGLAQPGLEKTTLVNRLDGLSGRVFAKTGSLSHVNSLSGYLVADDGRELTFAVLSNGSNLPANQVREGIDLLVRELAAP